MIECVPEGGDSIALWLVAYTIAVPFVCYMLMRKRVVEFPEELPALNPGIVREYPIEEVLTTREEEDMADYETDILTEQVNYRPEMAQLAQRLRDAAQALAAGGRVISSDDVHGVVAIPTGIDPRIMGAAFTPRKLWQKVDYVPSTRGVNNKRPIARWRLRDVA